MNYEVKSLKILRKWITSCVISEQVTKKQLAQKSLNLVNVIQFNAFASE